MVEKFAPYTRSFAFVCLFGVFFALEVGQPSGLKRLIKQINVTHLNNNNNNNNKIITRFITSTFHSCIAKYSGRLRWLTWR